MISTDITHLWIHEKMKKKRKAKESAFFCPSIISPFCFVCLNSGKEIKPDPNIPLPLPLPLPKFLVFFPSLFLLAIKQLIIMRKKEKEKWEFERKSYEVLILLFGDSIKRSLEPNLQKSDPFFYMKKLFYFLVKK